MIPLYLLLNSFLALVFSSPFISQSSFIGYSSQARPSCLYRHSSCQNIPDGNYQLCLGCESGEYITCQNGYGTINTCSRVKPSYGIYYHESHGFQHLIYDSYLEKCQEMSTTCDASVNFQQNERGFQDPKTFIKQQLLPIVLVRKTTQASTESTSTISTASTESTSTGSTVSTESTTSGSTESTTSGSTESTTTGSTTTPYTRKTTSWKRCLISPCP